VNTLTSGHFPHLVQTGEWGILTETADEKRPSQNHKEKKTKTALFGSITKANLKNFVCQEMRKIYIKQIFHKKTERSPAKKLSYESLWNRTNRIGHDCGEHLHFFYKISAFDSSHRACWKSKKKLIKRFRKQLLKYRDKIDKNKYFPD
jgi:hypothetical protein